MDRYIDASDDVVEIYTQVMKERFPSYWALNIKFTFDLKRRMKKDKIILASIETLSAKASYLSRDANAEDGYDYLLTLDKLGWELASTEDKIRIISHELRHIYIDVDDKNLIVKHSTIDHDISDFYSEIDLNKNDPKWINKLSELTYLTYEQEKDQAKESKNK